MSQSGLRLVTPPSQIQQQQHSHEIFFIVGSQFSSFSIAVLKRLLFAFASTKLSKCCLLLLLLQYPLNFYWLSFISFTHRRNYIFHAAEICRFPIGTLVKDDEIEDQNHRAVRDEG